MGFYEGSPSEKRGVRHRRRHAAPIISRGRAVFEWAAMLLMLAAPAVGVFLFGAVRLWSIGPLMFLSFIGAAMCFARPLAVPEQRTLRIPIGGWIWILLLAYGALVSFRSAVPYESTIELLKVACYVAAYWAWTTASAGQLSTNHRSP